MKRLTELDVKQYKMRIASWLGWAKYSDSEYLLNKILRRDVYEEIKQQFVAASIRAA